MNINLLIGWKRSPAHIELLKMFINQYCPQDIYTSDWAAIWSEKLGEHPKKAIDRMIKEGFLIEAPLEKWLDHNLTLPKLKAIAKQKALPVSGKKKDLISMLIFNDRQFMESQIVGQPIVYTCSDKGLAIAEPAKSKELQEKKQIRDAVIQALEASALQDASRLVREHESKKVFQRGIGMDWSKPSSSQDEILSIIFSGNPTILRSVPQSKMKKLRVAAGIMHLFGTSKSGYISEDLKLNLPFDDETAARMVLFYASNKHFLNQRSANGGKKVEISCADDSCKFCQRLRKKTYPISKAPELPHAGCTHEKGCRCCYLPVI